MQNFDGIGQVRLLGDSPEELAGLVGQEGDVFVEVRLEGVGELLGGCCEVVSVLGDLEIREDYEKDFRRKTVQHLELAVFVGRAVVLMRGKGEEGLYGGG